MWAAVGKSSGEKKTRYAQENGKFCQVICKAREMNRPRCDSCEVDTPASTQPEDLFVIETSLQILKK